MPKRKRSDRGAAAAPKTVTEPGPVTRPSTRTQMLVSVLIIVHLAGVLVALSANLAPSFLHGELLAWMAPYHVSTGQDYILLPLELTHADEIEAPLAIEVTRSADPKWEPLSLTSSGSSNSSSSFDARWPNASRLLCWIATQQPDSEVLPEFAAQAIRCSDSHSSVSIGADRSDADRSEITAIRFYQPHVLSFDEDLVVEEGQGSFISEVLEGEVLYSATVIRLVDGSIGLVPAQESSLTSKPVAPLGPAEDDSTP